MTNRKTSAKKPPTPVSDEADTASERKSDTWLVRDDKLLVASLDRPIFTLAALLARDPFDVLRRLRAERCVSMLTAAGYAFAFEEGTEEEAELVGLALSGVPLGQALSWCAGDEHRLSQEDLLAAMPDGDCRPAVHQARELGIWFSCAEQLEDLRFLEESMPVEITQAAIEDLLEQFQPPTPTVIRQYVEGGIERTTIDLAGLGRRPVWKKGGSYLNGRLTYRRKAKKPSGRHTRSRRRRYSYGARS